MSCPPPVYAFDLSPAIDRAIAFLRARQLPHGEFRTFVGPDAVKGTSAMRDGVFDSSPFVTAFVVEALAHAPRAEVADMLTKAARFLRGEMAFGGFWRYWSTRQHKHFRLPPDLDDTACISAALQAIDGRPPRNLWVFRHARDTQGRFFTWLTHANTAGHVSLRFRVTRLVDRFVARVTAPTVGPRQPEDPRFHPPLVAYADVDPVVNANALRYVGERPESEGALAYLTELITRGVPQRFSIYYQHHVFLYHAVARAYLHGVGRLAGLRDIIMGRVCGLLDAAGANVLVTAAGASVLLTFDAGSPLVEPALARILAAQRDDGGWPAIPFYMIWGSEELTSAFCLDVLCRARKASMQHAGEGAECV